MAFQTPITVKEAVNSIRLHKYLLPAIQREVVWDTEQIERLFDSLMRDYPIGSFLFWLVEKANTGNYQFYEFIRDFHQRDKAHNAKANVTGQDDVIGILDGQQRLTSLYLGLLGSYAYKEPRKRWDNPQAFLSRRLHLNLLAASRDLQRDLQYEFSFLTDQEARKSDEDTHWFKVGDILGIESQYEVNNYLIQRELMSRPPAKAKFANETLFQLWSVVHDKRVINYFLEKDKSLDKVLNIFIRVNSGGTVLSYSDLLLSVAAAQWKKRDARETITAFVDEVNGIGNGFNIDKDFVLKSCLVLSDLTNIAFRVDNFNKPNMLRIESEWDTIVTAIRHAVTLVSGFGYNRDTLTAKNALIPIAYHLMKRGLPSGFDQASRFAKDRQRIKRWLIASLLKRVFGGQPDTVLRPIREILKNTTESFPVDLIIDEFKGTNKSIIFSGDDVENLLDSKYGEGYTFSTLALLYPTLDFRNAFHIDHIFARSTFSRSTLMKKGVSADDVDSFVSLVNLLPNLQLLEGIPNQEKSDADFKDWLRDNYPSKPDRTEYMAKHFIPEVDFSVPNFRTFIGERRALLKQAFERALEL